MNKRHFSNWLEGFQEYTAEFPSKPRYTRWAGISAIASALRRKNWTQIIRRRQYGNLYILLVGPPGCGKSVALASARDIVDNSKGLHLTPTRLTTAAFYMELDECKEPIIELKEGKKIDDDDSLKDINIHHSLTAMIAEMGTFVKPYDKDFMTDLSDLYDCPNPFEYRTKTQGVNYAPNSWFNLLGACTESYIQEAFSNVTLGQGFPARIILVYDDEPIDNLDLFPDFTDDVDSSFREKGVPGDLRMFELLLSDYQQMLTLRGNFSWTDEAQEYLKDWYRNKLKPYPLDPKLIHYNTRRLTHVSKLALIGSLCRGNTQRISYNDIKWAKATLLEAEKKMPEAIKGLGENQYLGVMQSILKYVATNHANNKGAATPEHIIRQFLHRDVPPYYTTQILDSLVLSKQLIVTAGSEAPNRRFKPGSKYVLKKPDSSPKGTNGTPPPGDPQITEIKSG